MGCFPSKSQAEEADTAQGQTARSAKFSIPCMDGRPLDERCPSPDLSGDSHPPWVTGHKVYALHEAQDGAAFVSEKQPGAPKPPTLPTSQYPETPATGKTLVDESDIADGNEKML